MRNPSNPITKGETRVSGDMTPALLRAAAQIVGKQAFAEFDPAQWT